MSSTSQVTCTYKFQFSQLYRGLSVTASKLSINWSTSLGIYSCVNRILSNQNTITSKPAKRMILGAVTGSATSLITAPLELVITQIQKANANNSTSNEMKHIYHSYGLKGFYNGFSPKILRATWSSVVVIYVLDLFAALPPNMQIK